MDVLLDRHWQDFVEGLVASGRYSSADAVVEEALRLVQEREEKLRALKRTLDASVARGGSNTMDEAMAAVEARLESLKLKDDRAA